eukprot:1646926-Prymnesium_polylepis.1
MLGNNNSVLGHPGPEPFADKQYISVGDHGQLNGPPVEDGLEAGDNNYSSKDYKESLAFESQYLQAFYPQQPASLRFGFLRRRAHNRHAGHGARLLQRAYVVRGA